MSHARILLASLLLGSWLISAIPTAALAQTADSPRGPEALSTVPPLIQWDASSDRPQRKVAAPLKLSRRDDAETHESRVALGSPQSLGTPAPSDLQNESDATGTEAATTDVPAQEQKASDAALPGTGTGSTSAATGSEVPPTEPISPSAGTKAEDSSKKTEEEKKDKKPKDPCDDKKKAELKKAIQGAYQGVFYDNKFQYVLDPCYKDFYLGDSFKRIPGVHKTHIDLGGQYRMRFHDEQNFRGLGLNGVDDDFLLHRTRLFANVELGKRGRLFAEYLDALSTNETFAPRAIEENRSDFLNLFYDAPLLQEKDESLTARVGRQEILLGDERLISPLDWANTRRTFDGSRLLWRSKSFQSDAFWLMPLRTNVRDFDGPNRNQQLYGTYSTYRFNDTDLVDTCYLAFDDDLTGYRVDNFGARLYEDMNGLLVDLWGNYQFGRNVDDSSHQAGAFTVGLGHASKKDWKPTLWVYFDWASGGSDLGAGEGFFHFFPLAHKYLGFMDLYGRRNIESPNLRFTFNPSEKLQVLVWYYYLFLENKNDTPYSVVMTPFAPGVTPGSAELGHEIDLLATYALTPRTSLLGGYSHFFSGDYYDTPGLPFQGDANFFYVQYQVNF